MNIFVLDTDPLKAAEYHNNKHCVKMSLESTQLLSNALWLNGLTGCYKLTHKGHPTTKWTAASRGNFDWLSSLALALCKEYTFRYGKIHKCEEKINKLIEQSYSINFGRKELTSFVQCMPDCYKCNDAVIAYRNYYIMEKRYFSKWKLRGVPYWF